MPGAKRPAECRGATRCTAKRPASSGCKEHGEKQASSSSSSSSSTSNSSSTSHESGDAPDPAYETDGDVHALAATWGAKRPASSGCKGKGHVKKQASVQSSSSTTNSSSSSASHQSGDAQELVLADGDQELLPAYETDGETSSLETCECEASSTGGSLLWELCCSPHSRLSARWMKFGFKAQRFAPELGADLSMEKVGAIVAKSVAIERPYRCWISVPCTHYSIMQNLRKTSKLGDERLAAKRRWMCRIVKQCLRIAREVVRHGGHCYFEWPRRCTGWKLRILRVFEKWLQQKGRGVYKACAGKSIFFVYPLPTPSL